MASSIERKTRAAACKVCGGEVALEGRAMIGEVVDCAACGAQLEVAGIDPLALEELAKVDDDMDP